MSLIKSIVCITTCKKVMHNIKEIMPHYLESIIYVNGVVMLERQDSRRYQLGHAQ